MVAFNEQAWLKQLDQVQTTEALTELIKQIPLNPSDLAWLEQIDQAQTTEELIELITQNPSDLMMLGDPASSTTAPETALPPSTSLVYPQMEEVLQPPRPVYRVMMPPAPTPPARRLSKKTPAR